MYKIAFFVNGPNKNNSQVHRQRWDDSLNRILYNNKKESTIAIYNNTDES